MQNKKCQWSSLLCIAISFPLNVICFWVSIVLSFFDPRKKEFFKSNKNCGFHDHILITATFSSIPLIHFSFSDFWPLVFVFSYFPWKLSYRAQRPLILKIISSTLTIWKNILNIHNMSRHKVSSFEIFISTLISSSGGDEHRQLGVPKNHPHQNDS